MTRGVVAYHNRRARRLGLSGSLTRAEWERALAYFNWRCAVCGMPLDAERATLDHWIPLLLEGGTTAENSVPMCPRCNHSKGGRAPLDWLADTFEPEAAIAISARIEAYFAWVRTVGSQLPVLHCPDCGQPMHVYCQPRLQKPPLVLAECKNADCLLLDVTLNADMWAAVTAIELEAYRETNRRLRQSGRAG